VPAKTAKATAKTAKLIPLGDRILVKQVKQEEVRASGLVIPDTAREKSQMGEILAVGPGRLDENGKRLPMDVKVGDRVLYAKYTGQDVPRGVLGAEEEEFLVLRESDILAKLG
jgi:chaperonin GroES